MIKPDPSFDSQLVRLFDEFKLMAYPPASDTPVRMGCWFAFWAVATGTPPRSARVRAKSIKVRFFIILSSLPNLVL
jgi:hypothetical protein